MAAVNVMSCWTWGGDDDKTHAALGRNRSLAEAMGGSALVMPRMVRLPQTVRFQRVTCGGAHCLAVTTEGIAFSWGWNGLGQLGDGTTTALSRPTPIPTLLASGIRVGAIAAGAGHSAAVVEFVAEREPIRRGLPPFDIELAAMHASLGTVQCYTWGAGKSTQLGYPIHGNPNGISPVPRIVEALPPMLKEDSLALFGPHDADSRHTILSCGSAHTILLTARGSIISWGANGFGQCSRASVAPHVEPARPRFFADERVASVACGGVHTLVLTAAGRVLSFGCNAAGQLGAGSISSSVQPVPQPVAMPLGATVAQIACGEEFSCALLADGKLLSWGFSGCGQLGHGARRSLKQPAQVQCEPLMHVACGAGHMAGVTVSGALLRWGYEGTWKALQQRVAQLSQTGEDDSAIPGLAMRPQSAVLETADTAAMGKMRCAHFVAAGRHFVIVLADGLALMVPREAATLIQRVIRARQKRMAALRAGRERAAASVLFRHFTRIIVRRELARSAEEELAAIRDAHAVRLQSHVRRRAQMRKLAKRRLVERHRREMLELEAQRDEDRLRTLDRSDRAFGRNQAIPNFAARPPKGAPSSSARRYKSKSSSTLSPVKP